MSQPIEKRIATLRDQLNRANHLYHVEARPEISDREYDKLMQELIDLLFRCIATTQIHRSHPRCRCHCRCDCQCNERDNCPQSTQNSCECSL